MKDGEYTKLELNLRTECESGFKIGPRTAPASQDQFHPRPPTWLSPTGEPFVELTNPLRKPLASDDECYHTALELFRVYAHGRPGTMYWRVYPEIERGRFYMRLLISDKPPLAFLKEMK
jgi:hypothetical protein